MNASNLKIALVAGIVGASLATGVQAFAQHQGHDMASKPMAQHGAMQPGSKMLHDMMMKMASDTMHMKMAMDNDTDRMFAKSMADHHAIGVKMAQIELKYGNDAKTKALAKKIIAAQTKERAQLVKLGKTAK